MVAVSKFLAHITMDENTIYMLPATQFQKKHSVTRNSRREAVPKQETYSVMGSTMWLLCKARKSTEFEPGHRIQDSEDFSLI